MQQPDADYLDSIVAAVHDVNSSSWTPVDLTDALAGVDVAPPARLARTDGIHLLYAGRTHGFAGESESCKSWAALLAAAQEINAGNPVLWIDFEDDDRGIVARLLALGATPTTINTLFTYVRPEEPLRAHDGRITAGGTDFATTITLRAWTLIVIDGVTEAMVTEGLDINSNADVATWNRLLPKRCASTGAAVVMVDHVTKSSETRGRYALGAQHKLAGLTGAQYVFDTERPFSRASHDPITGIVRITVTKDRPGHVRSRADDGVIARLELTSYPDGGVTAALVAPDQVTAPLDVALAARIAEYLTTYPGATQNKIEANVDGKTPRIRAAIQAMVSNEWVTVVPKGQSHLHHLTPEGEEYFQ